VAEKGPKKPKTGQTLGLNDWKLPRSGLKWATQEEQCDFGNKGNPPLIINKWSTIIVTQACVLEKEGSLKYRQSIEKTHNPLLAIRE
jgi:hypothetical protein